MRADPVEDAGFSRSVDPALARSTIKVGKKLLLLVLLMFVSSTFSTLNLSLMKASAAESPYIMIVPESTEDPTLKPGMNYTISIKTDYDGSDVWGYEFKLTYNPRVLHIGIETTDMWIGNGTTTEFNTTHNLVVEDSEKVYVDENLKTRVTSGFDTWTGDDVTTTFDTAHTPVVQGNETVYRNFTDTWIGNGVTTEFNTTQNQVVKDSEKVYIDEILKTKKTENKSDVLGTGDDVTTTFNTTYTPVVQDTYLTVYVNNVQMTRDVDYTIDYDLGAITFTGAPGVGAEIRARYHYGHYFTKLLPKHENVTAITFMEAPSDGADIKATYNAKMTRDVDYTIDYDLGAITFPGAPSAGININATYDYGHYKTRYEADMTMTINFTYCAPAADAEIRAVYVYDGVTNGDLITEDVGPTMFISAGFNNTIGQLYLTGNSFFFIHPAPPPLTSGPGTLAYVTFRVVGTGTSDITLETNGPERTKLIGYKEVGGKWEMFHIIDSETHPDHIGHGFFSNGVHDIAVTNVAAHPPNVLIGDTVDIDVTVTNEGDFTETFNVTAYYDDILIAKNTSCWDSPLASKDQKTLTFVWETTDIDVGTYAIKANATIIEEEENKTNNKLINGTVTIEAPSHDIAVTNVNITSPSPPTVNVEDPVSIDVIVANEGGYDESFDVTVYADSDPTVIGDEITVGTQSNIALVAKATQTLPFTWTTTGVDVGTYTISANATTVPDETDTKDNGFVDGKVVVTLPGYPTANFTYSPKEPLVDEEVTFNATASEDPGGEIVSYRWDFGDGTKKIYVKGVNLTAITTHSYTTFDEFMVSLNVTDNGDHTTSTYDWVTVYTRPVASFTYSPSEPSVGDPVTFNATASYDPDGGNATFPSGIVSYEWDFGDETPAVTETDPIVEHTYTDAGEYPVTLTVTDDEGMTNDTTATVTVSAALVHDIAVIDVTPNPTVAAPGQYVSVTVNVKNKGDFAETFNVTAYYDTNSIGTKTVTLDPDATGSPTITWDTTFVAEGTYTISANASAVDGETDKADNSYTDGTVTVQRQVGPGQMLSIEFSGEREYLEGAEVKIRLVALVRYADTMEPVSNATVDILIYDPEGTIWNSSNMVERLALTGIYEWESSATIAELELEKGFYLIHVVARRGSLAASEISQFHIATVEKTSSIISIDVDPTSVTVGSNIIIGGAIAPKRPLVTVTILYRAMGGNWSELGSVKTSTTGHYSINCVVTPAGIYEIKANWLGDTRTEGAESEVKTITIHGSWLLFLEIPPYMMVGIAAILGSILGSILGPLVLRRVIREAKVSVEA